MDNNLDRRRFLGTSSILISALAGCPSGSPEETPTSTPGSTPTPTSETTPTLEDETPETDQGDEPTEIVGTDVTVRQESGKTFYWVLPGKRRLSPSVFGTPDSPRYGADWLAQNVEAARQAPPETVPQLLQDLPFLLAAPESTRTSIDDPIAHQKLTELTLYSDEARVTSGELEVVYKDRQPWDTPGPPGETQSEADLRTEFTDPAGNEYELELDHLVKPPFPPYQTGGGVITNAWHHGTGLPGSPLMPRVYTYGAFWGVGDVIVNGEVATEDGFRVIHFMTTQTVRDQDYRLAIDEELPLMPGQTIAGQVHHTHGVVLPIMPTPDGPVFEPVPTAFELPNGQTQPFIHAMWEQDEVVEGPFQEWTPEDESSDASREVTVRQEAGHTFYWVLPGERRLSPRVFGTPSNQRFGTDLLEYRIEQAKQWPAPLNNAIPQLLEDLPSLVAAPDKAREEIDDSVAHQKLAEPTLFSDEAQVTKGEFEITYKDHRPYDLPGAPGDTPDDVDLTTLFADPAGNEYRLEVDHVVQPPIPGYETGGGVITNAWHHGLSGTGSPLMPHVYSYGACWAVGDVIVNGEVATEDGFRVIHFMTTQAVRDQDYRLAVDEELPLTPNETIAGQAHHTHGVVLPIRPTPDGPVFDPVPTAFELPNGQTQPFIHAMWEQEELVEAPFARWSPA